MRKLLASALPLCLLLAAWPSRAQQSVVISGTGSLTGNAVLKVEPSGGGGGGRSAVFNGTSSYASGTPGAPGDVPAAQGSFRFMAKLRGLVPDASLQTYVIGNGASDVLYLSITASGAVLQMGAFVGGGGASTGTVTWSLAEQDVTVLVRCDNTGAGEVSLEVWRTSDGTLLGQNRNTSAGTATTNFFATYYVGASSSSSGFMEGKIDKLLFTTGAGSYSGSMPDVEAATGDLLMWTFDADTGEDTASTADLDTLTDVTFENTP